MNTQYKKINLLRLIAYISVFLYHLNILKGGFLAVCTFFVLSAYLSCISSFKKDKFSFKNYYLNKLKKIYLPLIIVVFSTIAVVSLFPNIFWMNLKPETTSVLLGYNNYWQLNANLDYFTNTANSPFIHLWYIAILIQFDLVFPFIFIFLRKLGDKINKIIPSIITFILAIGSCIYFYLMSISQNIMVVYYDTFIRLFSILLGVSLGFICFYYNDKIKKIFKNNFINNILFYLSLLILIILYIFGNSSSPILGILMLITSLISCLTIKYATIIPNQKDNILNTIIYSLSKISYEIYLIQYPVIFLFKEINIDNVFKVLLIISITIILASLLHYSLSIKKGKNNILKYLLLLIFITISSYGTYKYIIQKDYTDDMKKLEEQLAQNEQALQLKQEEYLKQAQEEKNNWQDILNDLENSEEKIKQVVSDLHIIGIGDSVMLGATPELYKQFKNGYFDAKVSRTDYEVSAIINNLKARNIFGDPVLLNLGANGDCKDGCKTTIMQQCEGRQVFWVNVTNNDKVGVNGRLNKLAEQYSNLHIIDWETISKGHPEYFVADRIHLTSKGSVAFTNAIYDAIYKMYLDEYNQKKEAIINEHNEKENEKITFYGNNILINSYNYIKNNYQSSSFVIDKGLTYDYLYETINNSIKENTLTNRLVFVFDKESTITENQFKTIFELCKGKEIYFITSNQKIANDFIDYQDIKTIDFSKQIQENKDYIFVDGIHLTDKGNNELKNIIISTLNNKENTQE